MRSAFMFVLAATVCLSLLCTSCSEDQVGVPVTPQDSQIVIDPEPDSIDAPWLITGPGGFSRSGNGDITLSDLGLGDYTLTWGAVTGWNPPDPATATRALQADVTLVFSGAYIVRPHTITIDPVPDTVDTTWQLTGPDGYSLIDGGNLTLPDMEPGDYTMTWGTATGWSAPIPAVQSQTLDAGGSLTFTSTYDVLLDLQEIQPGAFEMGSPPSEPGREDDETSHPVTLTRGYWMATQEVTEWLWRAVMGGASTSSRLPKTSVDWFDAIAFCNELSLMKGLTPAYSLVGDDWTWDREADGYRLPTEAEWEYACRAGSTTALANGPLTVLECDPLDPNLDAIAWYRCNSGTNENFFRHDVGLKQANAWGLFDMNGNVFEWCWDWYGSYQEEPATDPSGPTTGHYRVIRGGDFTARARDCRSAHRYPYYLEWPIHSIGLRIVRSAGN
jgi:formylglycine-generating enzyme required for sulfatase activity